MIASVALTMASAIALRASRPTRNTGRTSGLAVRSAKRMSVSGATGFAV